MMMSVGDTTRKTKAFGRPWEACAENGSDKTSAREEQKNRPMFDVAVV